MTTIENIPRIVIWAIAWVLAGVITYFMDKEHIKGTDETPFPFWRAVVSGGIGFILILGLCILPPTNMEDEGYTED